jgi:uncharacterized protein (TIGR03067 family)
VRTALFVPVVVVVSSLGAGAAPVPKHLMKEPESEKAKLQGKWRVESLRVGGKDGNDLGQGLDMVIEFRGDTLTATTTGPNRNRTTTATVKHDATAGAKCFATVNTVTVDHDGKSAPTEEKNEGFAYAFDGDKLLLAVQIGSKERADPLKPGPNDLVITLTRVKEK